MNLYIYLGKILGMTCKSNKEKRGYGEAWMVWEEKALQL